MKKIVINLFVRLGFVTVGKLMAFVSVPIISRALGPEQYGIYNLVFAIAGYAFLPANWGFGAKGIREVAKTTDAESYKVVEPIVSARLTLWWISGVVTILICAFVLDNPDLIKYIVLGVLANLGLAASIDFYFYGKKDTFTPSLSSLIGQVLFLILVLIFVKNQNDLFLLLGINIVYKLMESLIMFIVFNKKHTLKVSFISKKAIPLLKENFLLGLGSKASFFQTSFPLIIIPLLLTVYDLGVYSATFKLFLIITLLVNSINLVFSPNIVESREHTIEKRKRLFKNLILGYTFIGLISGLALYFLGPYLMDLLFGEEFQETQSLIRTFALFFAPIYPLQLLLSNYMNNFENDKSYFKGALLQTVCTLIGIPILIQLFALEGVIYTLGFSCLVVSIYYIFCLRKSVNT